MEGSDEESKSEGKDETTDPGRGDTQKGIRIQPLTENPTPIKGVFLSNDLYKKDISIPDYIREENEILKFND